MAPGGSASAVAASCTNVVATIFSKILGLFKREVAPDEMVAKPPKFVADLKWAKAYMDEVRLIMQEIVGPQTEVAEEDTLATNGHGAADQEDIPTSAITSVTLNQAACIVTALRKHASTISWGTETELEALENAEEVAHTELLKVTHMMNMALNIEQIKLLLDNNKKLRSIADAL